MSSFVDNRGSPNQQTSFIYQTTTPEVASVTSSVPRYPTGTTTSLSREEDTKQDAFTCYEEGLDYTVSRLSHQEEVRLSTETDPSKRRASTMKTPVKIADTMLQTKEPCTISHGARHSILCQRFPCHLKPKCSSPSSLSTPVSSIYKSRPSMTSEQTVKYQKLKRVKEAKKDYEFLIKQYYTQLMHGCGQSNCRNKFCHAGRGSILDLHHQAAMMMATQLAHRSDRYLCILHSATTTTATVTTTTTTTKLHSLPKPWALSPLMSFFNPTPSQQPIRHFHTSQHTLERKKKLDEDTGWLSYVWSLWDSIDTHIIPQDNDNALDSDSDNSSEDCDAHSESMLLAIQPITIDRITAMQQLHILITSNYTEQMKHWCRSVFQNWEGIGNSFLSREYIEWNDQTVARVDLIHLSTFFTSLLGTTAPRQKMAEAVADSFEILLDRMNVNLKSMVDINHPQNCDGYQLSAMIEWCRSLLCVSVWVGHYQSSKNIKERMNSWSTILSQKHIQVFGTIASHKQSLMCHLLLSMLTRLHAESLENLVEHLQDYLVEHFHTGPYRQGNNDIAIITVKCLDLLYQANQCTTFGIPTSLFYNDLICKKMNIKEEYRAWRRVDLHGEGRFLSGMSCNRFYDQPRRTRLFLATPLASSSPFVNTYQFSWFNYTFLFPPSTKRRILQMDAMAQMSLEYEDACVNHTLVVHAQRLLSDAPTLVHHLETHLRSATYPYLLLDIRREHFVEDTWDQVSRKWTALKKPLKVRFVEGGEEGMDQGGVQKEYFGVLFEKLLSSHLGLFEMNEETRLYWFRASPATEKNADTIRLYEMVGVMIGLAIYNGIMVNLPFSDVLWKVVIAPSERNVDTLVEQHQIFTLSDLANGWPSLGQGLHQLLHWPEEVEDVFARNYEISMEIFGQGVVDIPLIPKGESIPVTNANRAAFVEDYCAYFLYHAHRKSILAVRRGVWSVIGSRALSLFTSNELKIVACGLDNACYENLDMEELQDVADYDDGYHAEHLVIRHFWSIVHHSLTGDQKRKLLFFVTASDRVPIGGLKELSFIIQRNGPDSNRLPTALTCFSRLLLPEYSSREKLRKQLVTAIENSKGFGLV
ncbi:hypothetical protein BDF14DRAFT_1776662 [Spinellus fusiger]|nr:hypothetical protein BDF14DRAFT_1776662 [Spinellus fusiger]